LITNRIGRKIHLSYPSRVIGRLFTLLLWDIFAVMIFVYNITTSVDNSKFYLPSFTGTSLILVALYYLGIHWYICCGVGQFQLASTGILSHHLLSILIARTIAYTTDWRCILIMIIYHSQCIYHSQNRISSIYNFFNFPFVTHLFSILL